MRAGPRPSEITAVTPTSVKYHCWQEWKLNKNLHGATSPQMLGASYPPGAWSRDELGFGEFETIMNTLHDGAQKISADNAKREAYRAKKRRESATERQAKLQGMVARARRAA